MTNQVISDLMDDPAAVDVSTDDAQFIVQCEDVRLISSVLHPIVQSEENEEDNLTPFAFRIRVLVDEDKVHGFLETQVNSMIPSPTDELIGYHLICAYMATFSVNNPLPPNELGNFAKFYTLSILWPYAREYAADVLRRTGEHFEPLPIINPQVLTKHLIENDMVEVTFANSSKED